MWAAICGKEPWRKAPPSGVTQRPLPHRESGDGLRPVSQGVRVCRVLERGCIEGEG